PLRRESRVTHIEEGCDSCGSRNQLPEQLYPLRVNFRYGGAQPRDIRARMCEARDDALSNRIADANDDHGNRDRGILGRQSRRRAPRQDQVRLQPYQLSREAGEPVIVAIRRAVLDGVVLSLNVPEGPQTLSETVEIGGIDRR